MQAVGNLKNIYENHILIAYIKATNDIYSKLNVLYAEKANK